MVGTHLATKRIKKYNEFDSENTGFALTVDRTFWGAFRFALGADIYRMIVRTYDRKVFKSKDPYFGDTMFPAVNVILPTPNAKQNSLRIKV